ncbi:MAG: chromate transporter [Cytophagales bacterium]|nr:chromate transporter [Cytophagales bacterium]
MSAWQLNWSDWWSLCSYFMTLSLLAIGGAITTTPDIHRYLVDEHGWLTDTQFNSSIAIAQAAPGPNVLFIALMGWNVGLAAEGWIGALAAMAGAFLGMLIPSSLLTLSITRWMHANRKRLGVQAFKAGLVPVTLALLVATAWILSSANQKPSDWPFWLLTLAAALLVWRTKIHLLWLLGLGAIVGASMA